MENGQYGQALSSTSVALKPMWKRPSEKREAKHVLARPEYVWENVILW
jgi:hypothetical protein